MSWQDPTTRLHCEYDTAVIGHPNDALLRVKMSLNQTHVLLFRIWQCRKLAAFLFVSVSVNHPIKNEVVVTFMDGPTV